MLAMRSPQRPRPYQEEAPPLHVADPTLASGLRDPAATSVTSVASHYPGDMLLSAKAAGRVWSVGGGGSDGGRLTCWSPTTGQVIDSAACPSCVAAIALVPTVRPAAPLRATSMARYVSSGGGADGFACELFLWAGTVDGRISIYAAADLQAGPRAVLSGHRAAITCLHAPSAPPTSPAQGAAIVLSAAPDCEVRLWDARSGDCLRSIPCDGSQVVAMLALWAAVGAATGRRSGTGPQCRVWSAAANRTLSTWEPQLPPMLAPARPARVQSVGLGVDVTALAASTDGKLVGAVAGAMGPSFWPCYTCVPCHSVPLPRVSHTLCAFIRCHI
jgi:WD40 repeat protein